MRISHRLIDGICLGRDKTGGGDLQLFRRERNHQIASRHRVVRSSDELAHHPEPAIDRDRAARRRGLAADEPQKGGLADAVRADERNLFAVADAEADIVEQFGAPRTAPTDMAHLDRTHERTSIEKPVAGPTPNSRLRLGTVPDSIADGELPERPNGAPC